MIWKEKVLFPVCALLALFVWYLVPDSNREVVQSKDASVFSSETKPSNPVSGMNLLLISLDTLRKDRLGLYGDPLPISPFLDRLSTSAIVFSDMVVQFPATRPSHRSLFTSQYPFQQSADPVTARESLAGTLARAGYRTAAFVDGGAMNRVFGNAGGFALYDDKGGHLSAIRPKAEKWLTAHDREPFFLFLHTYDIHSPYDPPYPYSEFFTDAHYSVEKFKYTDLGQSNAKSSSERRSRPKQYNRLYDGGIRYCDHELDLFFQFVARRHLLDNTIVIIFSDHGESLGEHRFVGHGRLFEEQLRVPFFMIVPGHARQIISNPVETVDIMPTILQLLGLKAETKMQGIPLLTHNLPHPRYRLSESRLKSIREDDQWKLVMGTAPRADQLYHIGTDPEELKNVIKKFPGITKRLRNQLYKKLKMTQEETRMLIMKRPERIHKPADNPALEAQLRQLGYIH